MSQPCLKKKFLFNLELQDKKFSFKMSENVQKYYFIKTMTVCQRQIKDKKTLFEKSLNFSQRYQTPGHLSVQFLLAMNAHLTSFVVQFSG